MHLCIGHISLFAVVQTPDASPFQMHMRLKLSCEGVWKCTVPVIHLCSHVAAAVVDGRYCISIQLTWASLAFARWCTLHRTGWWKPVMDCNWNVAAQTSVKIHAFAPLSDVCVPLHFFKMYLYHYLLWGYCNEVYCPAHTYDASVSLSTGCQFSVLDLLVAALHFDGSDSIHSCTVCMGELGNSDIDISSCDVTEHLAAHAPLVFQLVPLSTQTWASVCCPCLYRHGLWFRAYVISDMDFSGIGLMFFFTVDLHGGGNIKFSELCIQRGWTYLEFVWCCISVFMALWLLEMLLMAATLYMPFVL